MKRALAFFVLLGALPAIAEVPSLSSAPAKNFEMKLFTREGPISVILRGSRVEQPVSGRLDVVDLNITSFTGNRDLKIESILLSPAASFLVKEQRATSNDSVRLIRDEMEVTGNDWTYERPSNKVTIQKNTRVVFHTPLPDLIR